MMQLNAEEDGCSRETARQKVPNDAREPLTVLTMTNIINKLQSAKQHAWVCSAGSNGYRAVKEMLQNGVPGHTLLIEGKDLLEVEADNPNNERRYCRIVNTQKDTPDELIPMTVTRAVIFTNSTSLTKTDSSGFLSGCSGLKTLDLSSLPNVMEVQWNFLEGCCGLTQLDLSPFSQLTEVQGGFLEGCSRLTALDLGPLSNVTEIHRGFLEGCCGLTELDLSPLSKVTTIHERFLWGCSGLTTLDLSPLSKVTEIQGAFLEGCCGLTDLDLSPLSKVMTVQERLLWAATLTDH